jgi:hypothetical protein
VHLGRTYERATQRTRAFLHLLSWVRARALLAKASLITYNMASNLSIQRL